MNIEIIDYLEHDSISDGAKFNSLVKIDDTHYILAYYGDSGHGYIKTFSIGDDYNIEEEYELIHNDTHSCVRNSLSKIDSTHFLLTYDNLWTNNIDIKTFSINGSYEISEIEFNKIKTNMS